MMKEYTVVYIKDYEEYSRDTYKPGATIYEIVKELTYEINRYGKDCDYITIFDAYNEEDIYYYKVVNLGDRYILLEIV